METVERFRMTKYIFFWLIIIIGGQRSRGQQVVNVV